MEESRTSRTAIRHEGHRCHAELRGRLVSVALRNQQDGFRIMWQVTWDAAASLARTHGIYAIAQALRVSYESLKRHVEQPPRDGSLSRLETPGFVEVPAAQLVPSSVVAGAVVEITAPDGARLVVRLPNGAHDLDVLHLADTFWRRRS